MFFTCHTNMFAFYILVLTTVLHIARTCNPGASYTSAASVAEFEDEHFHVPIGTVATEEYVDDVYMTTITTSIATEIEYDGMVETETHQDKLPEEVKDQYVEIPENIQLFPGMNPGVHESRHRHTHPEKCQACSPQHLQFRFCHSDFGEYPVFSKTTKPNH